MRYSKIYTVCAGALLMAVPYVVQAGPTSLSDDAMAGITAQGISTGGGSLSSSCADNSTSVCVGTYEWNDNHQFDASTNKGAILMNGNTQQNLTSNINSVGTQSAIATGANVVGDLNPNANGDTFSLNNYNNATSFIGGF